jgi:hypothetical protein
MKLKKISDVSMLCSIPRGIRKSGRKESNPVTLTIRYTADQNQRLNRKGRKARSSHIQIVVGELTRTSPRNTNNGAGVELTKKNPERMLDFDAAIDEVEKDI